MNCLVGAIGSILLFRIIACQLDPSKINQKFDIVTIAREQEGFGLASDHHSTWLGSSIGYDAAKTLDVINSSSPHILLIDHYAITQDWTEKVRNKHTLFAVQFDDTDDKPLGSDVIVDMASVSLSSRRFLEQIPIW